MALAAHFGIEVKHTMRKQVIKNTLNDRLVADDLLNEECCAGQPQLYNDFS